MARKKPEPEHENLERWMVSYSDFVTLLFATFVVLYALSQADISGFMKLEDSMRQAFAAPSLMQGTEGIMENSDGIFEEQKTDSMIAPLMMEYLSPKYEENAYQDIEKNINSLKKEGQLDGVDAEITEQGLLITLNNDLLFKPASATLTAKAMKSLDKIGVLIGEKFVMHYMRIEGHTDNLPLRYSKQFPSNWELSAARASVIVRYMIERFKYEPSLFTAVGFADTRPVADNKTATNRAKNRRVEILVLKNKYKGNEKAQDSLLKLSKSKQEAVQAEHLSTVRHVRDLSDAAKALTGGSTQEQQQAIILDQAYKKEVLNFSKDLPKSELKSRNGSWLKPPAQKDISKNR